MPIRQEDETLRCSAEDGEIDFEKTGKKLVLRAINNIYSIYLVEHLGSLKNYSVYTEMYKIKGVLEY